MVSWLRVWSNQHNHRLSLVWQTLLSSESEKRSSSYCLAYEQGYLLPCQSGCTVSLPWYACCWLEIDWSIDDTTPPKQCSIARTSWCFCCHSSRHTLHWLIFTEPYRFATGPASSLILSNILLPEVRLRLVQYDFVVSAIWLRLVQYGIYFI